MSIASELKDLVIKWGGSPTCEDDTIEELIRLLKNMDKPSSGGGSGTMLVNVTETSETIDGDPYLVYTCDKTYAEINAALEAGTAVWIAGCSVLSYGGNPENGYSYNIYPMFSSAYPFNTFSADAEHPYPAFWVNNTIN